jgi:phytoene dehydrogenase-like protein
MKETVGVIGGGLGGLSAACTLAARGYRVQVFEKNEWLGGKAAVLGSKRTVSASTWAPPS